ncbi:hypothetical protein F5883DRAFT_189676 [Diaporthe sp. PMI_573]|nr:hypothetical protein F5883DRAFT_189676 [Diaporthaceae sp. PMI_573]
MGPSTRIRRIMELADGVIKPRPRHCRDPTLVGASAVGSESSDRAARLSSDGHLIISPRIAPLASLVTIVTIVTIWWAPPAREQGTRHVRPRRSPDKNSSSNWAGSVSVPCMLEGGGEGGRRDKINGGATNMPDSGSSMTDQLYDRLPSGQTARS